jgi:hypothetical protein
MMADYNQQQNRTGYQTQQQTQQSSSRPIQAQP